jgi:hypothetical protein
MKVRFIRHRKSCVKVLGKELQRSSKMQIVKCLLPLALGAPFAAALVAPLPARSALLRGSVAASAAKTPAKGALTFSAFQGACVARKVFPSQNTACFLLPGAAR